MTSMSKLKLMAIIKSVKVSVTSMPIMASMTTTVTTMMRTKSSMKIENTMINNKIARTRIALLRALSIF